MSIFGIGMVVIDHAVLLDEYPECDTKTNVRSSWKQVGGPVPVALSTASFYGTSCAFLGRWGDDEHGECIFRTLTDRGIDITSSTCHPEWSTGFAQVWVTGGGERTIAYSRGDFPLPTAADITSALFDRNTILHLDGWASDAAIEAARQVRQLGGMVVLDAGSMKPGTENLFPFVDVLIASGLFRRSCFGEDAVSNSELLSTGCRSIITTHGRHGARWIDEDSFIEHRGFDIDAVDTNGAGDIFSGAILHGLSEGQDRDKLLPFANATAALACTHFGNSTLPTLAQVNALIDSQPNE